MVKSQAEKVALATSVALSEKTVGAFSEPYSDTPPKIPPRMKKRGPALPEKPLHMRVTSNNPTNTSQAVREPLKPKILSASNIENRNVGGREVLVAASSKSSRERPVEKRQREPAKLLVPTTKGALSVKDLCVVPSQKSERQRIDFNTKVSPARKSRTSAPPILLIPRNMLGWGSAPVSYALWMQRDAALPKGCAPRREPVVKQHQLVPKFESSPHTRSGSVTRSGSLTSQDSSSSDSGNETFPKSVLKKQKKSTQVPTSKDTSSSSRKIEPKKNVTFNAFATVQLMEE